MKKTLITVACALTLIVSLSVLPTNLNIGPFGVDVVSAASETTSTSTGSTSTKVTGTVKLGSKGSAVKALQTNLNNNGYNLTADGVFGKLTLDAVKDYQGKNGLVADGIAGPKTLAKLNPTTTTTTTTSVILKFGSKGDNVKTLQTKLNENGYKLTVDGVFGSNTLTAVKSYQAAKGLTADGIAGPNTFGKLYPATTPTTPTTPATPDVVTSASVTDNAAVFEKSIGTAGKWIVCTTKDLTFDHAIVVDGNFTNGKNGKNAAGVDTGLKAIQRKIALYTQLQNADGTTAKDADGKNITDKRFTLTAPKITILSINASIEQGTIKGDIYVSAQNFQLKGATVQGNIFFTNKGAKDTFKLNDSTVSGMQSLLFLPETVDAYASASKVMDKTAFVNAISSAPSTTSHKWIIAMLDNLDFTKEGTELVLDGNFKKAETDADPQRKLAIYAHDINNSKLTTARFILTAPKLTINSANANISKGMFKGDVYVTVPNFKLVDAIIDGNVYFTTQAAKDTFQTDATSIITGKQELKTN
jgi:peptidoglycan hydrolase-like protein with peptidoglycan-binding domain